MQKIINHKMYDTDTADLIEVYENFYMPDDPDYLQEKLYRKFTKEYFVFGFGGVRTKYGQYRDLWSITPLTDEEAKNWLEEYGNADVYIDHFGIPEE